MTYALSLAMKRFLALLLLAALPLQGLATLFTHTFPGDYGNGAPATLVEAHGGQHDNSAADHSAPLPHDDTSCCIFAGFCYGTPGLFVRFWSPLGVGFFTTEPVLIALSSFTSFTPESSERPPLAIL